MITIYSDGACRGNQNTNNTGGWGYVMTDSHSGKTRECWGHEVNTTNSRMEMIAIVKALTAIQKRPKSAVTIYTDSNLIVQGMNEWLSGWKAKGWRKAGNKPVLNAELWKQLDALSSVHEVTWFHVKGHSGIAGNELADTLANRGADGLNGKYDYQSGTQSNDH